MFRFSKEINVISANEKRMFSNSVTIQLIPNAHKTDI